MIELLSMPSEYIIMAPYFESRRSFCTLPSDWTSLVFKDSDDAETALCHDRAAFVQQNGIKAHIPRNIWMQIIHPEGPAHIAGFRELFVLLNTDPGAENLRRLIFNYFANSLPLRENLSEFATSKLLRLPLIDDVFALPVENPGALPPPFPDQDWPREGHQGNFMVRILNRKHRTWQPTLSDLA